jgi:CRISPR-associated endonuclease Csn1
LNFSKLKPYKKEYGSYSEKAIKKLLILMRRGENWNQDAISDRVTSKIISIRERLESINYDVSILEKVSDNDIPNFRVY